MNTNHPDTDRHSNDLTQLSSREQLSALMDGALPADQTRFLLRRLQHDDSLAASWERWRLAGEAMRGLAPAQRLPADFAQRVSAALQGDGALPQRASAAAVRAPAWRRWSGGAAIAASLAVVALLAIRPGQEPVSGSAPVQVAVAPAAPAKPQPAPEPPAIVADAPAALAAAAVAAKPLRERRAPAPGPRQATAVERIVAQADPPAATAASAVVPLAQQDAIVTRPWPRSILPQYAHGGLTVGLGEGSAVPAPNPFQQPRLAIAPFDPAAQAQPDAPQPASETP